MTRTISETTNSTRNSPRPRRDPDQKLDNYPKIRPQHQDLIQNQNEIIILATTAPDQSQHQDKEKDKTQNQTQNLKP